MTGYPFLPLGIINSRFEPELTEAARRVIDSGRYIGGPEVELFEGELAAMCDAGYCVGVSTGLDALRLILRAFVETGRLCAGDEIIVPANSYIASAIAIVDAGLVPVFADPSCDDFLLHTEEIERLMTDKTRGVMPVDLYGRIALTEDMATFCRDRGLVVVEDAAQAIGAWRKDCSGNTIRPGSLATAAAFSFYPAKNVGALGDAGAVVTDDSELADVIRTLSNYGESRRYHCPVIGYNCRLDPIQAAMLRVKLPHTDEENAARRRNALAYLRELDEGRIVLPPAPVDGDAVHQFVIRCIGVSRDRLRERLVAEGVETAIHYPVPINEQPAMKKYTDGRQQTPNASMLASQILSLPVSSATTTEDVAQISSIINSIIKKL